MATICVKKMHRLSLSGLVSALPVTFTAYNIKAEKIISKRIERTITDQDAPLLFDVGGKAAVSIVATIECGAGSDVLDWEPA